MSRRLPAEGLGVLQLAAAVIGSGTLAGRLAGGNQAVTLLADTGATVLAPAQWLSEFVATAGLVLVVLTSPSVRVAAWRFTASASLANPAIAIARSPSDRFAGIRPDGRALSSYRHTTVTSLTRRLPIFPTLDELQPGRLPR